MADFNIDDLILRLKSEFSENSSVKFSDDTILKFKYIIKDIVDEKIYPILRSIDTNSKNKPIELPKIPDKLYISDDFKNAFSDILKSNLNELFSNFVDKLSVKVDVSELNTTLTQMNDNVIKTLNDSLETINSKPAENVGKEQSVIGDKIPEISLTLETLKTLKNLLTSTVETSSEKNKNDILESLSVLLPTNKENINSNKKPEEESIFSKIKDWILTGMTALIVPGIAMVFAQPLWDNFLKPFMLNAFDYPLKSFDSFVGKFGEFFDAAGKWFTQVGMLGVGLTLGLKEKMFGWAEKVLTGIFTEVFPSQALEKTATFLPKIGGLITGKLSKGVLRAIPFIGSAISFYDAYKNYENGDLVGMGGNIISGLASLVPGYGTAIAIGVDVINGILDYQSGDTTGEAKTEAKLNILSLWSDSIRKYIKTVPVFSWLGDLGEGFGYMIGGDWKTGLDYWDRVPIIGTATGILRAFTDSFAVTGKDEKFRSFDFQKFLFEFQKRMYRNIIGTFPSIFGLRDWVAKSLGINDYNTETDEMQFNPINRPDISKIRQYQEERTSEKIEKVEDKNFTETDFLKNKKELAELQKRKQELESKLEQLKSPVNYYTFGPDFAMTQNNPVISDERNKVELQLEFNRKLILEKERIRDIQKSKTPFFNPNYGMENDSNESISDDTNNLNLKNRKIKKADDIFLEASNASRSIFDPVENTEIKLNANDNITAYKGEGILEKSLNEIKNVIVSLNANYEKIQEILINNISNAEESSINNINISSANSNINNGSNNLSDTGKRDYIFDARMEWWKIASNERIHV